jgi:hypothetical protein
MSNTSTRRQFLRTAAAVAGAVIVAPTVSLAASHAVGSSALMAEPSSASLLTEREICLHALASLRGSARPDNTDWRNSVTSLMLKDETSRNLFTDAIGEDVTEKLCQPADSMVLGIRYNYHTYGSFFYSGLENVKDFRTQLIGITNRIAECGRLWSLEYPSCVMVPEGSSYAIQYRTDHRDYLVTHKQTWAYTSRTRDEDGPNLRQISESMFETLTWVYPDTKHIRKAKA